MKREAHNKSTTGDGGRRRRLLAVGLGVILVAAASCAPAPHARPRGSPANASVTLHRDGPVSVTLDYSPSPVDVARELFATIRLTTSPDRPPEWPDLSDRFQGFTVLGSYDDPPRASGGAAIHARHVRLQPRPAPEYRLAPLAFVFGEKAGQPAFWFATQPFVFPLPPPPAHADDAAPGLERMMPTLSRALASVRAAAAAIIVLAVVALLTLTARLRRLLGATRPAPAEEARRAIARHCARPQPAALLYGELGAVLKRLLGEYGWLPATGSTGREIAAALARDPSPVAELAAAVGAFFEAAERMEFAAAPPSPDEAVLARTLAETVVAAAERASLAHPPSRRAAEEKTP